MTAMPIALSSFGLVTGVGLNAPATCAAIRCAVDNFQETRFMDNGGEWIMGCEVPLEKPWRGRTKLIKMAAMAIRESLSQEPDLEPEKTPLFLCLAETERVGRVIDDDNQFFHDLCDELGMRFHDKSRVIAQGHVGFVFALKRARGLIHDGNVIQALIAGVDGYLEGLTLAHYEENERLLTSRNSNGFVPGEAATAALVRGAWSNSIPRLVCLGVGFGVEEATIYSEAPLRAEGLVKALRRALQEADYDMGNMNFRMTDVSGEQYHFKEASLALSRTLRKRKDEFDIWHPADCMGDVGAAMGGIMTAVVDKACRKGYTKGQNILFHLGNDDGYRVAMVFSYQTAEKG